jgi:hypothetical protein
MTETRTVKLEVEEWQRILQILATAAWRDANPLIMRIGEQLRMQEKPDGVQGPAVDTSTLETRQ